MEDNNPYAVSFRSMRNKLDEENEAAQNEGRAIQDLQLYFMKKGTGLTEKVYSLPSADEIAAVCAPTDEGEFQEASYVSFPKHGWLKYLSVTDPTRDGIVFPVLFTKGVRKKNVSQSEYYRYRIARRTNFSSLHLSSKLYQEYLIYAALSVVSSRLIWVKNHQQTLRVETYKGLRDYINRLMIQEGVLSGERFILPSSFEGSERNLAQHYYDSMTLVKEFGHPDLLITFTSNPRWDEIISIIGDDSPANHPDIVSKIFIIQLQELLDDIVKHHILGKVSYYCYRIEFQKRGLPHAHILITFQQEDKLNTTNKIDNIISAEIPSIEQDSELHNSVLKHMVHRECHEGSECWENNECKKGFPKQFCEFTQLADNGYPFYQRKDNSVEATEGKYQNNRWVVPYNRILLLKYNAHINVEHCVSLKSIKYVFKYMEVLKKQAQMKYKITLMDFMCAHEAYMKILGVALQRLSHSVTRLAIHLPNEQFVYFQEENETSAALNPNSNKTTLTAFFTLNEECKKQFGDEINESEYDSRKYTYDQIPKHFTFDKTTKLWKPKLGGKKTVVRLYNVSPKELELFFPLTSSKNSSKITQAKNGLLWNQVQLVDVIIWDEVPMASKWAIESVDKKLKEIRKNDKDFGGVLMIFGGDFRQVLSIVKFGGRNELVNASVQKSNLWRKFDCLKLKKNMRTGEGSEEFSSFLMQIENGTMQQDKNETIDIPNICISQENLIKDVFGDEILNTNQQANDVILCTTNSDSDDINDCVLRLLKCEPIQLLSSDKVTLKTGESLDEITRDVLNNLTPAALPPHILNIKIGASIMLLRNMNI
ncbi:MAG: putative ATP-dependent DNA helicase PIF1, partial [Streblomastix strix]